MAFYTWTEAMSVGVSLLDSDHRALIDAINRLHDQVEGDGKPSILEEIFDELIAYTEFHFAREEKVMAVCEFPPAKSHQEEHASFTQCIYDLRERHAKDPSPAMMHDLLHYLKDWLNHHILIQDMAYKAFAEGNEDADEVARMFGPGLADVRKVSESV